MTSVPASYYYQEILRLLLQVQTPIRERCRNGFLMFQEFLQQETSEAGVYLSGTFAKLHYLFQDRKVDEEQIYIGLNDYRVRMGNLSNTREEVLQSDFAYDMLRLARLVAWRKQVPLPIQLKERLPQLLPELKQREGRFAGDFRVVVLEKHDDILLVYCVNEGIEQKVRLKSATDNRSDFTALLPLIEVNTNLNLVDTRWVDDVLEPTLIVLEPDFLISVTAIASCIQPTGVCSEYEVVSRLQPVPVSKAILLGNMAGQMLDEELHGYASTYPETARRFFTQNAVQCYTCTELNDVDARRDFHNNAQRQQQHLRSMVQHQLRDDLHLNTMSDILLEPAFFCELLGLQGRMDLLSRDFTTVIEQKSGKMDEWSRRTQLSHNIQLQLYRAILHFSHKVRFNDMRAYLLYSKYPPEEGLMRVETIMDYLRTAMQVRNEIVARELLFSTEGIADYLEHFDVDRFTDGSAPKLWVYKRPDLEQFIGTYRKSSSVARAYFNRFHRFLSLERRLGMVGSQQRECSGFASAWNATLEEKQEVGNIMAGLSLAESGGCVCNADGAVESICLKLPQAAEQFMIAPNFREGDIVVLYAYEANLVPDMRKDLVFRATIVKLTAEDVTVQLRAPQTNAAVFAVRHGRLWAIEKDFMEAASTSLFRGLFSFLSGSEHRRNVLLNPSLSVVDSAEILVLDHQDDERNAMVLKAKQARDFFLLVGPPGTGKTSFGLMSILREELASDADCNVLLAAYTNRAVDEICSKLVKDGLDFLRVGNKHNCDPEFHAYLLENKVSQLPDVSKVDELIKGTRIIVGTVASLSGMTALLIRKGFSLAIIDEASQLLEPHLLPLLMAGDSDELAIQRFVFIGDHKQLPAVVQQTSYDSCVQDEELQAIGLLDCRNSLFERLYYAVPKCCVHEFTKQGRMHPEVAHFANQQFYGGQLRDCGLEHQLLAIAQPRVVFYPCIPPKDDSLLVEGSSEESHLASSGNEMTYSCIPSAKVNIHEARMIAYLAEETYQDVMRRKSEFNIDKELGIIVPYRHQIAMVRSLLQTSNHPLLANVTIDTVERFQGSEKNTIIYGFTVSRPSQLNFLCDSQYEDQHGQTIDRKLNVALTRARERTLLVGNPEILSQVSLFAQLIAEVPSVEVEETRRES